MPLRPARVCRFAIRCQEKEATNDEAEEIDIYDPGDSDPYTHEYILMHEPFRRIPLSYYPDVDYGFYPPRLVFGIGLLRDEAVAYAEEQGILGPPGSEYSGAGLLFGFQDMASHFTKLYGHRFMAATVLSRKCDIVLALFDNYSRPKDVESRRKVRDIMRELVKIFPAARERRGYFYWAMNESMYPRGYSRLMYKQ
ncbi:hypothetical protein BDZ89DRAFT_1076554 [Hymenopellis radicata]|nr:hypothetical protein BDZ89DRAFT_1076554 [Hymenopellis radicata]